MNNLKNNVDLKLKELHRSYWHYSSTISFLVISTSIFFQREKLLAGPIWIYTLALILIATFLRFLSYHIFFKDWTANKFWAKILNISGLSFFGLGHGLHLFDVLFHFGSTSPHAGFTLLVIACFVIVSGFTMSANRYGYYAYVTSVMAVTSISYAIFLESDFTYIPLFLLSFYLINIVLFRISSKQLYQSIESQFKSDSERIRLLDLINAVPGIVGFIDRDKICYLANKTALNLYPSAVGKKIGTLDPGSKWEEHILNFLESDKVSDISEESTSFRGNEMYALLNMQKTVDGGAIIIAIVTTELVIAKQRLREQEGKAIYTAKLASLGEMAAGIAHEVNNPLTIIQGASGILKHLLEQTPLDVIKIKSMADKVIETSERIGKTVRSLKAISRNGENDPSELFSIRLVIDQCLNISGQRLKQYNIELKRSENNEDIKLFGREVQISQVLINLLNNAIDAILLQPEKWIEIKVELENQFVSIKVIDSGPGIPKKIQQRIMEPFFTTKDVNQGTGLGLSISKNIIQGHGGEFSFCPDEPFTTFLIKLPASK